jgi:hypothetical protein
LAVKLTKSLNLQLLLINIKFALFANIIAATFNLAISWRAHQFVQVLSHGTDPTTTSQNQSHHFRLVLHSFGAWRYLCRD